MNILGISCFYHDAAAALLMNGQLVGAAEEERFSRKKHDSEFPLRAIRFCLEAGKLTAGDLDYVVFYEKPFTKFERILQTVLGTYPRSARLFRLDAPLAGGQALGQEPDPAASRGERGSDPLFRAPSVPRGQRVLLLAVRGRRDPDRRRRRRVGDGDDGRGARPGDPADEGNEVPALAGPPLQRLHGLPGLRGQRGRVQGDGHGAVRRATLRRQGPSRAQDRRGRKRLPRHGLLLVSSFAQSGVQWEVRGAVRSAPGATEPFFHADQRLSELLRPATSRLRRA